MSIVVEKYRALGAIGSLGKAMNGLEGVEIVLGRVQPSRRVGGGTGPRRFVDALLRWLSTSFRGSLGRFDGYRCLLAAIAVQ